MHTFKHKTLIQIRFKDVDMMGHVNNANHFTYLEYARVKYFNDVAGEEVNWTKQGIILAKAVLDYKIPILFNDTIYVYTKCSRIGNKSFDLEYKIIKSPTSSPKEGGAATMEAVLAEASTVLVCYDYEKGQSILMPEEWKRKIKVFEK